MTEAMHELLGADASRGRQRPGDVTQVVKVQSLESDSAPVSALSATATRPVPSRRRTRATQTTGPARGDQLCLLEPTTGADNGDTEVGS